MTLDTMLEAVLKAPRSIHACGGVQTSLATHSCSLCRSHAATKQDNLPQHMLHMFLYLPLNQQTTSYKWQHSTLLTQLAVETVFLEAANELVAPSSSGLSGRQAEALERLAFDWALNAETYVEPKFGELTRARERV